MKQQRSLMQSEMFTKQTACLLYRHIYIDECCEGTIRKRLIQLQRFKSLYPKSNVMYLISLIK